MTTACSAPATSRPTTTTSTTACSAISSACTITGNHQSSRECNGNIINVGTCGYFWTSTMDTVYYNDGEQIWGVRILNGNKDIYCYKRCDGHSIRLVQK